MQGRHAPKAAVVLALVIQTLALIGLTAAPAHAAPLGLLPGDLVVADGGNDRVVVVEADGDVRVLAAGIDDPRGVAVTPGGDVVVAENATGRILLVSAVDGVETILATGVSGAWGVAISEDGSTVYATGTTYSTVAAIPIDHGGWPAPQLDVDLPRSSAALFGIAVAPGGDLVVADWWNSAAYRLHESGGTWSGSGISAFDPFLFSPTGVAVGPDGEIVVADEDNDWVARLPAGGGAAAAVLAGRPAPQGVAIDIDGSVVVADRLTHQVTRTTADGATTSTLADGSDGLLAPYGVAVVPPVPVVVGDVFGASGGDVLQIHEDGSTTTFASGFGSIGGLAVDNDGDLLVAAGDDLIEVAGDGSAAQDVLAHGYGTLTAVAVGPHDEIYVGNVDGDLLEVLPGGGTHSLGGYNAITAIAPGPDGTVYFSDNLAVRKVIGGGATQVSGLTGVRALGWDPTTKLLAAQLHDLSAVDPSTGTASSLNNQNGSLQAVAVDAEGRINLAVEEGGGFLYRRIDEDTWSGEALPSVTELAAFVPWPELTAAAPPTTGNVATAYAGYDFDASAPGGLTVRFTVHDGTLPPGLTLDPATGALSGTPTSAGSYAFRVQAANPGRADVSDEITIVVGKKLQELEFTSAVPMINDDEIGDQYRPTFDSASGKPVTISIDAASASVCEINADDDGLIDYTGLGTCRIHASQAGDSEWEAATVTQDASVWPFEQVITFQTTPGNPVVGDTYDADATSTGGTGNPITYSIPLEFPAGACTVDATTGVVTFVHAGNCRVQASQAGDALHYLGVRGQNITIGQAAFAFTSTAATPHVGLTYTPATTYPSATFSVDDPGTVCEWDAGVVRFVAPGDCVLHADTGFDPDWDPGTIDQTITVTKRPQTVSFGTTAPSTPTVGATYTPTATAGSGLGVTIGVTGSCSISAGVVTFGASGTCTVRADQAGNGTWAAAFATQVVTVARQATTLEITSTPTNPVRGATYDVTARLTPAGGPILLTTESPGVCSLAGATVTFEHAGSCVVRARFEGSGSLEPASTTQTISVARAATTTEVALLRDAIVATVDAVDGGTPTGDVVFTDHGEEIGTGTLFVDGAGDLVAVLTGALATGSEHVVEATYRGDADYTGSVSESVLRTDPRVVPHLTSRRALSEHGWYRAPVRITFTCTPGTAPLVGGCPAAVRLTENRRGLKPITVGVAAEDGGAAEVEVIVRIDKAKPKVKVRGIGRAADKLRCVARDRLSGVDTCSITTRVVGDRVRYRAVALDLAGNKKVVRGRYSLG